MVLIQDLSQSGNTSFSSLRFHEERPRCRQPESGGVYTPNPDRWSNRFPKCGCRETPLPLYVHLTAINRGWNSTTFMQHLATPANVNQQQDRLDLPFLPPRVRGRFACGRKVLPGQAKMVYTYRLPLRQAGNTKKFIYGKKRKPRQNTPPGPSLQSRNY